MMMMVVVVWWSCEKEGGTARAACVSFCVLCLMCVCLVFVFVRGVCFCTIVVWCSYDFVSLCCNVFVV